MIWPRTRTSGEVRTRQRTNGLCQIQEIVECLRNCRILKKDSDKTPLSWSYYIIVYLEVVDVL
jgi:hypothetical protein